MDNLINIKNKESIEYLLQKKLYEDLKYDVDDIYLGVKFKNNNYLGILNFDDVIPFNREDYLNVCFRNNLLNFPQNNNSFYFWKDFDCFTFKYKDEIYFIGCNNKLKLFNYIKND
jgi:hypothetical protein